LTNFQTFFTLKFRGKNW